MGVLAVAMLWACGPGEVAQSGGASDSTSQALGTIDLPALYTWWNVPAGRYYNLDSDVVITRDPGANNTFYWAFQYWFQNGKVGYMGIQEDAPLPAGGHGKTAIFSIWGGTAAVAGPGVTCKTFSENGTGKQCLMPYNWLQNHWYRLRIWTTANNQWSAWIKDLTANNERWIGTITVPAGYGWLNGSAVNFTEDFAENGGLRYSSCAAAPHSGAVFRALMANNETIWARSYSSGKGAGQCNYVSTVTPYAGTFFGTQDVNP
jgi:hypothetical protein